VRQYLCPLLALAVAVVLAYVLLSLAHEDAQGKVEGPLPPSRFDARMIALDKEALDDAYRSQISHLFVVWMKDETGQPARAINGARQTRRAYVEAMTEIEKREH
jgi:hypothetical protein